MEVANAKFPKTMAVMKPKSCMDKRYRVRDIFGKYIPNGSEGKADFYVGKCCLK
jgi:hypothetical protein